MILDPLTTTELIELIMAIDKLKQWRAFLAKELKRRERLEVFKPVRLKKEKQEPAIYHRLHHELAHV